MEGEKFKKLNISIPPDMYRWIKKKQEDFKEKNPLARLDVSPIIADCIRAMMKLEEGKAQTGVGAVIRSTSENSDTGPLTLTKKPSRKAG